MLKLTFYGHTLPKGAIVTIDPQCSLEWVIPERAGLRVSMTPKIKKSFITVECNLSSYAPDDLVFIYIRAIDFCQTVVDLLCFRTMTPCSVHFDSYQEPNGKITQLIFRSPSIALRDKAAMPDDKAFSILLRDILQEHAVWRSLQTLMSAFREPHISPINCGRTLDGIRKLISPKEQNVQKSWTNMRAALNIERSYIQPVMVHSTDPRHGGTGHISPADTSDIADRTLNVFNRYLHYRLKRGVALQAPEFPLLVP